MFKYLILSSDKYPTLRVEMHEIFMQIFIRQGHQIDWILQADGSQVEKENFACQGYRVWVGRTVEGESIFRLLLKNIFDLFNDLKLFPLTRKNNYDFLIVKDKFITAILGWIATRRKKTRFFYWLSYPFPEAWLYLSKNKISNFPFIDRMRGLFSHFILYKFILRRADHIFVQSKTMKIDIGNHGILGEKITPVPMGVSFNRKKKHRS